MRSARSGRRANLKALNPTTFAPPRMLACACLLKPPTRLEGHGRGMGLEGGSPPAQCRTQTFPPRGKSAENVWQPPLSRNRAPPHRRHGFAATKMRASCFASTLPQDLSAQLMFELCGFSDAGLSHSPGFEFCAGRCGARAARRRGCRASASQDA